MSARVKGKGQKMVATAGTSPGSDLEEKTGGGDYNVALPFWRRELRMENRGRGD